ncbi:MAG TPA: hypothetical protein PLB18_23355 [Acidobacteriota bacterium]|nr:hypothetical protein [Acidobacteriota bacterium]HND22328.1 hypothetical protein [Acidobacteriota bacterium]
MTEPRDIINCTFIFKCPQQWEHLQLTLDPKERFCPLCRKSVRLIESQAELERFAHQPQCVAIPHAVETEAELLIEPLYTVGAIAFPSNEPVSEVDLFLEPVEKLDALQLKALREVLNSTENLLHLRRRFATGHRELLLQKITHWQAKEVVTTLCKVGLAGTMDRQVQ